MDPQEKSIGEIISHAFNLTDEQMSEVLRYQRSHKVKFGEAAVALGMIKREDVLWALSQQFQYPYSPDVVDVNPELVIVAQPFSPCAEVFRDVRSQLLLDLNVQSGLGHRALAITSPNIGDGKSFFCANLAASFSQLGGRTVLVDADLRTPRQHEIFGVQSQKLGLSSMLAGRVQVNVVRPLESMPNLYLLPAGTIPPNPLELVQRPAFALLIQELLSKFDHVLVDTPAAEHGYDAKVVAAACGHALIISRQNDTQLDRLEALSDTLSRNAKVLGVLINDI